MNYFEFYDLSPSYFVDESELKKRYYEKMRSLHPDMHMSASVEDKNLILQQSSYNNEAFKTLKDFHLRLTYVVDLYSTDSSEKVSLPPTFLMEMMDINEEVMELQMDNNTVKADQLLVELKNRQLESENKLISMLSSLDCNESFKEATLKKVQEYLLERNYLNRLVINVEKLID